MNDIANEERLVQRAQALQRTRRRRILIGLAVCVAIPTLLAVVYYGFMASSQYESVAIFSAEIGIAEDNHASTKKGGAEAHYLDLARSHMTSPAMLEALTKHHEWAGHYGGSDIDFRSRLASGAGSEDTYAYFRKHVEVKSESSYTMALHVHAYSPERAREIAQAILDATSEHLARESNAAREALMRRAEDDVDAAKKQLLALDNGEATDLQLEVARTRLASATRAKELVEAEAARRMRRLVVVSEPSKPTQASRPRRGWNIATVFVTALALAGMVLLLGGFLREHAKH